MEALGDDFDAFFQKTSGSPFGVIDTALPVGNTWPFRAPMMKIRSQSTFYSGSMGNPRTCKQKFGYVSSFPEDLLKGELDTIANEKVSHLVHYVYYSAKNITPEAITKTDSLELSEPHGCTLKAIQDLSAFRVLRKPSFFFKHFILVKYGFPHE